MSDHKYLGIQLTLAAVQCEGINAVLDRIQATGADAVTVNPGLTQLVEPGDGVRQPPLDIDGYSRLLDRPLWGKREFWSLTHRVRPADDDLFQATPYRPTAPVADGVALAAPHTDAVLDPELAERFVGEAKRRGLEVYTQAVPNCVPGLLVEDRVAFIDGTRPEPAQRVASQGCLNNPRVMAYAYDCVRDVLRQMGDVDGIFLDWIEYTTYGLGDHFACFCPHCQKAALEAGYDWERIRRDMVAFWDWLHRLDGQALEKARATVHSPSRLLELLRHYPGVADLLAFKADTVLKSYRGFRAVVDRELGPDKLLGANGWCPPFNRSSGMDYRALADVVTCVRPKLFTFHWSAIPRWYGQVLKEWNPDISERHLLDAIVDVLGLDDEYDPRSFAKYHIPEPDQEHPARPIVWRRIVDEVVDQIGGHVPCYAYAHSYRSLAQWKQMIAVVRDSPADGMWVQRYGYMTDAKMDALASMWI